MDETRPDTNLSSRDPAVWNGNMGTGHNMLVVPWTIASHVLCLEAFLETQPYTLVFEAEK